MVILSHVSILLSTEEGIPPLQLPLHLLFLFFCLIPVSELHWNFPDPFTTHYTKPNANHTFEELTFLNEFIICGLKIMQA